MSNGRQRAPQISTSDGIYFNVLRNCSLLKISLASRAGKGTWEPEGYEYHKCHPFETLSRSARHLARQKRFSVIPSIASQLHVSDGDTLGQVRRVIACHCVFEGSAFVGFSSTSMKFRSCSKPKTSNFAEDTRIPRHDFKGYTHSWETSGIVSLTDSS